MSAPEILDKISKTILHTHSVELLLLYGSRMRGDFHLNSDWDFFALSASGMQVSHSFFVDDQIRKIIHEIFPGSIK